MSQETRTPCECGSGGMHLKHTMEPEWTKDEDDGALGNEGQSNNASDQVKDMKSAVLRQPRDLE